jgi:putative membrane protein
MSTATPALSDSAADRRFFIFNAIISIAALGFLSYLLYIRRAQGVGVDLRFLPSVNATLNGLSASCLIAGYIAIRRKAQRVHKYFMVSALVASALFFVCYVLYHYAHGDTKFTGVGAIRLVYFFVLGTHVLLSMTVLPLALTSLYFALRKQFTRHRKVTRYTLPIWLYVSVTGVIIYFMLRGSPPAVG